MHDQKLPKIVAFVILFSALAGGLYEYFSINPKTQAASISTAVEIVEVWCGNNIKEPGESCDGTDFGEASCISLGYIGGSLACNANCTINRISCLPAPSGGGTPGGSSQTNAGDEGVETPLLVKVPELEKTKEVRSYIDLNADGKIGVSDLSIILYFFGKTGENSLRYDFNRDGSVSLADISILLYYWDEV